MHGSYRQLQSNAPGDFAGPRRFAADLEQTLASRSLLEASHAAVESMVAEQALEWGRQMFQAHLDLRGAVEVRREVIDADHRPRTRVRESARSVTTRLGVVTVPRLAYQAPNCCDLHPMDASLNLPTTDRYSHGLRRMVAMESARGSFDEVVQRIAAYTGASVAKRQVEQLAVRASQDFDAFYEMRPHQACDAQDLLVISTDAKGIVVLHKDLRDKTRKRAEQSKHKVETRLTSGEKKDRKRMAQVAAVYDVRPWERTAADVLHKLRDEASGAQRPRPTNKRVFASIAKPARSVIREAFEEASRRDPARKRRWVILVDGDPRQLQKVKAEAKRLGVTVTIVADVVHVLEYLWTAARGVFGETNAESESWVGNRFAALLSGRSGGDLARTIRWWAARQGDAITQSRRELIDEACRYLANRSRTRMMRYSDYLRDGLPIATGVIEGACRYLVKDRMDRTGARWSVVGAEAVLRLRAVLASGDFDEYWAFHLDREHQRNHQARYEGEVPSPLPVLRRHLRRVK